MTRATIAAVAALLVVAGCGSGGDTDTAPGPQQVAEAALLRLSDLPSGWIEQQRDDDEPSCEGITRARDAAATRASSPPFAKSEGADTSVRSVVYVYDDEAQAEHAYAGIVGDDTRACLTDAFAEDLGQISEHAELGDIRASTVDAAPLGSQNATYRYAVRVMDAHADFDFVADLAIVRVGRGLALVTIFDTFDAVDADLGQEIAATAARRLDEELNGG